MTQRSAAAKKRKKIVTRICFLNKKWTKRTKEKFKNHKSINEAIKRKINQHQEDDSRQTKLLIFKIPASELSSWCEMFCHTIVFHPDMKDWEAEEISFDVSGRETEDPLGFFFFQIRMLCYYSF